MDLSVKIGKIEFKNPLWAASGTFGTRGEEFEDFLKLENIGAIVTKTVTLKPREGNPPPRIVETPSGLLNSIGLENKGIDAFIKHDLPKLKKIRTRTVISIAGTTGQDIAKCITKIPGKLMPDAIELNLSCPNVTHGKTKYQLISQDPTATEKIVKAAVKGASCAVIVKLTPNVTDVGETAKAAQEGGADAVSLVNTYFGMAVNAQEERPVLGNVCGGLSGPAIKPMALKAVSEAYENIKIPIVGIGGIVKGTDVAEFMLCGARAVQIGTVNLIEPFSCERILKEFKAYLEGKKIKKADDIIGRLKK